MKRTKLEVPIGLAASGLDGEVQTDTVKVPAVIIGRFAVHRRPPKCRTESEWRVAHVQTGRLILSPLSYRDGIAIATELERSKLTWDLADFTPGCRTRYLAAIRRAVARARKVKGRPRRVRS